MAQATETTALKEIFNAARIRHIADETHAVYPAFDRAAFIAMATDGLDELSLMERLRRVSEALHATLPGDYRTALDILHRLAPRLNSGFVTMVLPDYVALYGRDDFHVSMEALKYFTTFGSSEFAVRHFLKQDPARSLAIMEKWSRDANEHVRRLASEGSRPRLPWSFKLDAIIADPALTGPIIDNLKADPSLYVRKSVANHLNDVTKDNPALALDLIESWTPDDPATAWIAKHALRSLIKKGDRRALTIVGAGKTAAITVSGFAVSPRSIALGGAITLTFELRSTIAERQRLVVDYAIHYVKKSGSTAAKIFKLRSFDLEGGAARSFAHRQMMRDFTTRTHHAGLHKVELLVNGQIVAEGDFMLTH
jgi:3-methyladenine DNA glycosylase AlkC